MAASFPTINSWLKDNRLEKKFKSYFLENEVIINDLLRYNEQEIEFRIAFRHRDAHHIHTLHTTYPGSSLVRSA